MTRIVAECIDPDCGWSREVKKSDVINVCDVCFMPMVTKGIPVPQVLTKGVQDELDK